MGKEGQQAGRARTVHGQDGHGTKWAGRQKAGHQLIQVKSQAGCPDENGTAKSEVILSKYFGL